MTKPEDQIAKDKEAVAKMIGAKDAMQASINRIKLLEETLTSVRESCKRINLGFNDKIYLETYTGGGWKPVKINDLLKEVDVKISGVI